MGSPSGDETPRLAGRILVCPLCGFDLRSYLDVTVKPRLRFEKGNLVATSVGLDKSSMRAQISEAVIDDEVFCDNDECSYLTSARRIREAFA